MTNPYEVACPVCQARPHNQCQDVPKGQVHTQRSEVAVATPERVGGRPRGVQIAGVVLGVVLMVAALFVNATMRFDGNAPNVGVYVVGGFGLLLVLAVFLDAVDRG